MMTISHLRIAAKKWLRLRKTCSKNCRWTQPGDEVYTAAGSTSSGSGLMNSDEESVYQGETAESLQDYLLWQMRLTPFTTDAAIALTIIDSIDESGYLSGLLEEIQQAVSADDELVEMDE